MKLALRSLLALLVLAGTSASAGTGAPSTIEVPATADATITISGHIVALGIGFEWARGTLFYRGRSIPFWVRGISVMDIGAAKILGTGEVFDLKSVADFEGRYVGSTFGSAVSKGASLALIKNERGVSIRVRSDVTGIRFNFSGIGVRIRLTAPTKADAASSSPGTPVPATHP